MGDYVNWRCCRGCSAELIVGALLGVSSIEGGGAAPAIGPLVFTVLGTLAVTLVPSAAEDIVTRGFWFRAVPRRSAPVGSSSSRRSSTCPTTSIA